MLALQASAAAGNVAGMRRALACGVDADARAGAALRTALHEAARHGHADAVRFLLDEQRVDPTLRDADGNTAFLAALLSENFDERVAEALASATVAEQRARSQRADTETALAAVCGRLSGIPQLDAAPLRAVRFLLSRGGFSVDGPNRDGATPLMLVCQWGGAHTGLVRELLAGGASLSRVDRHGLSPLRQAMLSGDPGLVRTLLQAGAPITAVDLEPLPDQLTSAPPPPLPLPPPRVHSAARLPTYPLQAKRGSAVPAPSPRAPLLARTAVMEIALEQAKRGSAVTSDAFVLMAAPAAGGISMSGGAGGGGGFLNAIKTAIHGVPDTSQENTFFKKVHAQTT